MRIRRCESAGNAGRLVVGDASSIARTFSNEFGSYQERDSLFSGPGDLPKFESPWQVTDNGLRLTTVIPMGGR